MIAHRSPMREALRVCGYCAAVWVVGAIVASALVVCCGGGV